MVEITNLGFGPASLAGYTFEAAGALTVNYTFPASATLGSGQTLVLVFNVGTNDPANKLYFTGVAANPFSSAAIGYSLRNGSTVVDAVATNGYTFTAASGVTAADWSGNVPTSAGFAGISRANNDSNTAADWLVASATQTQTVGSINPGLQVELTLPSPFTNVMWTGPNGFTAMGDSVGSGMLNTAGVATFYVSGMLNNCMYMDSVSVVVSLPTGLNTAVSLNNEVSVFPNPASDIVTVSYQLDKPASLIFIAHQQSGSRDFENRKNQYRCRSHRTFYQRPAFRCVLLKNRKR